MSDTNTDNNDHGAAAPSILKMSRPSRDTQERIFWGQLMHHRQRRRRRRLQLQQQLQVNENKQNTPNSILDWRDRRQRSLNDDKAAAAAVVPLSNCHSMVYTAEIQLGSPQQSFAVGLDTGVDDFYVPSAQCDETCAPQWRRYDAAASDTANTTLDEMYDVLYLDGEFIEGQFVQDTFQLGSQDASSITIENAIFAAVTTFHEYTDCSGQEGVLGLGRSTLTEFGVPSPVQQLRDSDSQTLRNSIFALYLDNTAGSDDYPEDPGPAVPDLDNGPGHEYDDVDVSQYRATTASSQLTIGALSHAHYQGCLQWHDAVDLEPDYGPEAAVYWSLPLQGVKVDDEVLPFGADMALLDSGSTFVIGPAEAIGKYMVMNSIECFDLDEMTIDAYAVDCSEGTFEIAATSCDNNNLRPLTFVVDSHTYQLTADELLLKVDTDNGAVCFLRVMADDFSSGWVLGDVFLNRYYAVFDFEQHRIGLARSIDQDDGSYCEDDWPLDLDYVEGVPVPEPAPTATTAPPVPSPSSSGSSDDVGNKTQVPLPKIGGDVAPLTPSSVGASSASSSGSGGAMQQSLLIAVSFVLGAVLMVFVITLRRSSRKHYRRADRPYSIDDGGEVELPALL